MNICRLCLEYIQSDSQIIGESKNRLHKLIFKYFNIQISPEDENIPNEICDECSSTVLNFNEFQLSVIKNQENLLETEIKLEEVYNEEYVDISNVECDVKSDSDDRLYSKYLCQVCNKQMYNKDDYDVHQIYHLPPLPKQPQIICDICGKQCDLRSLKNHRKIHEQDPQICIVCKKEFPNYLILNQHLKKQHIPRITPACKICGRIVQTQSILQMHMINMHKTIEKMKCSKCNIVLKDYKSLVRHNRIKHSLKEKRYKCQYCTKEFYEKTKWKDHEACHYGEARHECEICNRKFVHRSNYFSHRSRMHPKEHAKIKEKMYCEVYNNTNNKTEIEN